MLQQRQDCDKKEKTLWTLPLGCIAFDCGLRCGTDRLPCAPPNITGDAPATWLIEITWAEVGERCTALADVIERVSIESTICGVLPARDYDCGGAGGSGASRVVITDRS